MIRPGGHIVLGLSGGPDSVCLFHILKNLQREMQFALYVVHINHGLRPVDADADQQYVESLCAREQITCIPLSYDCRGIARKSGLTEEDAGRKIRYGAFWQVAKALVSNGIPIDKVKIAVAQNANDQAETVLFRLLRGTGVDGLSGISYVRMEKDIEVIRPLLDVKRDEIEAYCAEYSLEPRTDKTNLQPVYVRNKIRLELIPYLEKNFNQNSIETLIRLSKNAAEDKDYLWKVTKEALSWAEKSPHCFDQAKLQRLPAAIRSRLMMQAFEEIGLTQDITAAHLSAASQLIQRGTVSKTVDFPRGYGITITYEGVLFHQKREPETKKNTMELHARLLEPGEKIPAGCANFDWDKLKSEHGRPVLCLRTRRAGDFIRLKGGRKKIQDFMVDQKIPSQRRDTVPLVAVGQEVLWIISRDEDVFQHRYNEKYGLEVGTKRILSLETICEI